MALVILRCVFVLVAAGIGVQIISSEELSRDAAYIPWLVVGGLFALASGVIAIDHGVGRKRLDTITSVYFGLLIGLLSTYVLKIALSPVLPAADTLQAQWIPMIMGMVMCYTCISVLMQTKNDFRFIIPYVEFAKEIKGLKPYVLDTSVVIDGRIADVVETRVIDNQLIMPQFVISELQGIADSSDKLRRGRGRRGLDILNRLRSDPKVDLVVYERELPQFAGQAVDLKLVLLAKHLDGKIVTNDYNLNKVAKLHEVDVINLNDLSNSLKPVFLPGETLEMRVVKAGEEQGQGVGYLEDGTMVVIEGGRDHVNENIIATVTSVLQTSAGRMVFGKYESNT
ncbi:MAG: PIN/TRAM domain-containing protein [Planctomycetaceae bacterium]|nr:PIN/TRAM domain-containing protein [Planctomycetaceae bacterium]MCH2595767.1 PIN/TRAM domain-containing protein [Pirellulales bacterium]HCK41453.1 PIN/TRAM domain-containing protein [Planctomycetaceae bacterium]